MSRGVKRVLGVVAAIAVPFVAAPIAGMLAGSAALQGIAGGAIAGAFQGASGAALVGAGLGAAGSALTGGDPLTGAVMGGLGGFAGGGGFDGLFGGGQAAAAAEGAASAPGVAAGAPGAGLSTAAAAPTSAAAAAPGIAAGAPGAGLGAAGAAGAQTAGGLGGFFRQVGQGLLQNPAGTAQLAMTVYGRPPQDLTAAELAQLEELRGLADTNRALFEQRVTQANQMLQMAGQVAPNPEQAFAQYQIGAQRQLAGQTRGMGREAARAEQRRTSIRATQAGATAAAAEEARGRQAQLGYMQAGLAAMPTSAPQGYAGLAMPTYESLQERRDQFARDLARAGGDLFGGINTNRDEERAAQG